MYQILNSATMDTVGYVSEPTWVKIKPETGVLVPADEEDATGIAYRSTPYNLNGTSGVGAPVTVELREIDPGILLDDAMQTAEELDTVMATMFPNENGTTASQPYAKGKYFYHNGQFCKAKTAIFSGATFTLNTNYEVTTIAAELFSVLNS